MVIEDFGAGAAGAGVGHLDLGRAGSGDPLRPGRRVVRVGEVVEDERRREGGGGDEEELAAKLVSALESMTPESLDYKGLADTKALWLQLSRQHPAGSIHAPGLRAIHPGGAEGRHPDDRQPLYAAALLGNGS